MSHASLKRQGVLVGLIACTVLAGCGAGGGTGVGTAGLGAGEIDVTVTSGGMPDPGSLVQLIDSSQASVAEAKADSTGTAVFQDVPAGDGYTAIATDGSVSGQATNIRVAAGKTLATIALSTSSGPAGMLLGSVVSSGNEVPLAGAMVSVGGQSATTDSSGQFQLASVPSGSEVVSVTLSGYTSLNQTIVVKAGADNPVSLQLQPVAVGPKAGHTLITSSA